MKIKYPIIAEIIMVIILISIQDIMPYNTLRITITNTLGFLSLICPIYILYLIIRNIFRAIKSTTIKAPKGKD